MVSHDTGGIALPLMCYSHCDKAPVQDSNYVVHLVGDEVSRHFVDLQRQSKSQCNKLKDGSELRWSGEILGRITHNILE